MMSTRLDSQFELIFGFPFQQLVMLMFPYLLIEIHSFCLKDITVSASNSKMNDKLSTVCMITSSHRSKVDMN